MKQDRNSSDGTATKQFLVFYLLEYYLIVK